ncbi:alcohol oxidase [Auriculariales sp. MPI-PUGE-AT-0066]|nr:alcohol oxidase [Auriculariales sp. MPI-PUGE-AT-0066]
MRAPSCYARALLLLGLTIGSPLTSLARVAHESHASHETLRARNLVNDIDDEYDFVVVGGGLAGLVVGARLTEKTFHKVLVLEAGGDGSDGDIKERINIPSYAYYKSLLSSNYDWNFNTVPNPRAVNRVFNWPRGRGLGGSTILNGLYYNRPSKIEVDAWHDLLGDMDGADNWTWDSFLAAMKKGETFTPPSDDNIKQTAGLVWNADHHGTSGPLHTSFPGYTFEQVGQWLQSVEAAGGPATSGNTYGGESWGTCVSMSTINPVNYTRSTSRTGYLDPLPPRGRYHVVANAQVSRIIWDDSSPADYKAASAVEFSRDGGKTTQRVNISQEVILAAGTIGSPTILMQSGFGPRDVLEAAGVHVTIELPGVGQHLQDHVAVSIVYNTTQPTMESVYNAGGPDASDPKFLSYIPGATSYLSLTTLFGSPDNVAGFADYVMEQYNASIPNVPSTDPTVLAGNHALYALTVDKVFRGPVPVVELLFSDYSAGTAVITAGIQHPLSYGRLYINSSDPFAYPVIDANYFANQIDVNLLRDSLKLARRIGQAPPFSNTIGNETFPGIGVQEDAQWEEWLRGNAISQYHPTSTCAMLPRDLGGVVDARLRVYGSQNVRVIDSSVFPVTMAAHTMAQTYGLAEQGSLILLDRHGEGTPKGTASCLQPHIGAAAAAAVLALFSFAA